MASTRPQRGQDTAASDDEGLRRLTARLGHEFDRPALLRQALTHPSAQGLPGAASENYERLEFLGDRVIALLVAELLFERFPHEAEGPLAQRLAELVRRDTLAGLARDLELGAALCLAKGEENGGERDNPALLSDALEAVAGALYLDGGLVAARGLLAPLLVPLLERAHEPPQDAKTALQEWAQGRGLPLPEYREVGRSGPDHQLVFTIEVSLPGHGAEAGEGRSKRQAEQAAAERLLARLRA